MCYEHEDVRCQDMDTDTLAQKAVFELCDNWTAMEQAIPDVKRDWDPKSEDELRSNVVLQRGG